MSVRFGFLPFTPLFRQGEGQISLSIMASSECLYFVGIAGIGVSALAQIAQARGARVVGADPGADPDTVPAVARLIEGGATIYRTHHAEQLPADCTLLVYTAAARHGGPEMEAAKRRGLRTVSRADYLGELMNAHLGTKIAVSGTHGKTTTTAMIGHLLRETDPCPPTVFVGAEVEQLGGNLLIGDPGEPFVAEACEAYNSFLSLQPDLSVITNIEADHLDHYGDEAGVDNAFREFLYRHPRPGSQVIACLDDPGIQRVVHGDLPKPVFFSLNQNSGASVQVEVLSEGLPSRFRLHDAHTVEEYSLFLPGRHNIVNATGALLAVRPLVKNRSGLAEALAAFRGAERRLETLAEQNGITVLDDYAHHPTEIRATLLALRAAHPQKRLIVVFQPHLYSRTRDFLLPFAQELAQADRLLVTDIYPARETPIPGVTSEEIVTQARVYRPDLNAEYVQEKFAVPDRLLPDLRPGDLVVFMGAGDIREPGERLAERLRQNTSVPRLFSAASSRLSLVVLMGGFSAEREVSLSGGRMVVEALDSARYEVTALDLQEIETLLALGARKPDLVLPILHGRGGEDGVLQGILDWMKIPYVGSGSLASALAMNKTAAKDRFARNGVPVLPGETVLRTEFTNGTAADLLTRLSCPLFVKPNAEGSTFGATLVRLPEELQKALEFALTYDDIALIEPYVKGREMTCGVLETLDAGKPFALPVVEIVPRAEIYDYASKYAPGGSEHVIPARLSKDLTRHIQEIAVRCHTLLGLRDLSRTDFIVRGEQLFVLETNTLPGLTPTSLLPDAAKAAGYSFSRLLDHLISSALRRSSVEKTL